MTARRWALAWLAVSSAVLLVLVVLLTPWGGVPPRSSTDVVGSFTAEQVARGNAFHAQLRPPVYLAMVVGLLLTAWLGLTRRGLAGVRVVAGRVTRRWWLQVPVAVLVVAVVGWLARLPFAAWGEVVLRRWGLSTQGWGSWLADGAKGLGIGVGLTAGALLLLVGISRRLPRWWFLPASLGAAGLVVVTSFAYPVVFEPVFNSFRPLPAGELRTTLLRLATRDGLDVDEVLVADASRRTTRLNAYVSGFGSTRRIVVYDTLLAQASPDEVTAIVAHELGHAKHRDVLVGTAIGAAGAVAGVTALYLLLTSGFVRRRGVSGAGDPMAAVTVLALAAVVGVAAAPVESAISRQVEARADRHALDLTGDPGTVVAMQRRLSTTNLSDLDPPTWSYLLFATHPTAAQRIALARAWAVAHADGTVSPR
ncbi:MAG: M48 family metallopeptidase [Actinomycetota bacterium]|nr:M48 family metallopeptidase [Actinomycetota bacterium]